MTRIVLHAEYVNSHAVVYLDGKKVGEIRFPSGQLDLTAVCHLGDKHLLTMLVTPMPLEGVMLSYSDTASARQVKGRVARRGLCGDVYLAGEPRGARIGDVKVDTSVRQGRISLDVALEDLVGDSRYVLKAGVLDGERTVREFTSRPFQSDDLEDGHITLTEKWKAEKLWDIHTPQNVYYLHVSLVEAGGSPGRHEDCGFRSPWRDEQAARWHGDHLPPCGRRGRPVGLRPFDRGKERPDGPRAGPGYRWT